MGGNFVKKTLVKKMEEKVWVKNLQKSWVKTL